MTQPDKLWSVTTLTKLGLGTSEGLVRWRSSEVAAAAYDRHNILNQFIQDKDRDGAIKWLNDQPFAKTKKAAARGTDVHTAAEHFALGEPVDVEDHILPYVEQYARFLSDHRPIFHMAEAPVYNPTHGYAGTLDGIIEIDGKRLVGDIKTTAHAPDSGKSRPPFPEVALQLVAYRRAELVGVLSEMRYASGKRYYLFDPEQHHEPMPETDGAVCIVVSPFDYMVVPVRTDDVVWNAWRHVMEAARWTVSTSKDVFGPPITAPQEARV
jgi:hypothetical protein